jgi:Lon protease-like protein
MKRGRVEDREFASDGFGCHVAGMTGLNLPKKCGVMILPDCTLFPHGGLPLFIFEERYRQMLDQALEGDCVFAVARQSGSHAASVGTVGLVRASREREDGTSELLLHGVIRVRFTEWLEDEVFPSALIEPLFGQPLEKDKNMAAMAALRGSVEDVLSGVPEEVRNGVLNLLNQADDAGLMADLAAQQLVQDPDLRQLLLETIPVGERVALLCQFLEKLKFGN